MRYARMTVEARVEKLSLRFHPFHDPVLLYLFLISVCCLNPSSAFGILKFEVPDALEALQQITVNPNNGDVFVSGHSVLYQLTRNLQAKHSYRFEPVTEDLDYLQTKSDCSPRNSQGTVLEIDASGELLLHCGAVVTPGVCSVFLAENLNHVDQLVIKSYRNQVKPIEGLVGVFGSDSSHEFVLHVARSYDGNCSNTSAEIVRGDWDRSIMSFASFNQTVGFGTDDINDAHHHHHHQNKKTFNVEYLYGFEYNGFVYFLTVQQDSLVEPYSYETRLARVCKGDRRFISYTEVALSCGCTASSITGIFYNIAVAADLAPVGEEFARKFRIASNSSALYVIFGKSSEYSRDIDENVGYGLCVYTMDDVESFFVKVQSECYEGLGRRLQWINQDDPPCSMNVSFSSLNVLLLSRLFSHIALLRIRRLYARGNLAKW